VMKRRKAALNWEVDDDIVPDDDDAPKEEEEEEESDDETADNKRIRLAKDYLSRIEDEESEEDSEEEDRVASRLHREALENSDRLFKPAADRFKDLDLSDLPQRKYRGHQLAVTCVSLTDDETTFYTGSKDCAVFQHDVETGKRTAFIRRGEQPDGQPPEAPAGHNPGVYVHKRKKVKPEILGVAVSSDGKYLATGGRDRMVRIWDTRTASQIEKFSGHRDAVSCLSFRLHSHMLFSGSFDRCIKHWNIDQMGYVETLYGHHAQINSLSTLHGERCVSCGGDRTVRLWKIAEESQLVFNAHGGSIDSVSMVSEQVSVSGGDDGSLTMWHVAKKKPIAEHKGAHRVSGLANDPWISSVATQRSSDLLFSGSNDGLLKLWNADVEGKAITPVGGIPMDGFINGLQVAKSGRFIVAAIGQEHRFGRWSRISKARNSVQLVELPQAE